MQPLFGSTPRITPDLKRANARLAAGDYHSAGQSYESLLNHDELQGRPQLAFLYFQAGRARMMSGQFSVAVSHFKCGLEILSEHQRYSQLYQVGQRIKSELEQRGLAREARVISALIYSNMPAASELPTQHVEGSPSRLPALCPACGVTLFPAESQWIDPRKAGCPLCDSPVDAL
jgi:hypothetical protein